MVDHDYPCLIIVDYDRLWVIMIEHVDIS